MASTARRTSSSTSLLRSPCHHHSSTPSAFASSTSAFSSRYSSPPPTSFLHRSSSPTRVTLSAPFPSSSSSSIRFSLDNNRPISTANRSISAAQKMPRRTCMCSPTTHPGSFRCSLHKSCGSQSQTAGSVTHSSNRLNARRSAMTNSLVRIGGVEGDLVRRALAALIRPSSHQQRRRAALQTRPSRLSVMSKS